MDPDDISAIGQGCQIEFLDRTSNGDCAGGLPLESRFDCSKSWKEILDQLYVGRNALR